MIPPLRVLECCRKALEQYGRGEIEVWPRSENFSAEKGLVLTMPARIGEWEGYKVIREKPSTEPGRLGKRTATMIVRRPSTGQAWRLPADDLTDARTGAAGVLAADCLAAHGVHRAAIIGTGRVARSLAIHLAVCVQHSAAGPLTTVREVTFYSRSADRRQEFRERLVGRVSLPLVEAHSVEEATSGAGVVLLAAASPTPVLEFRHLAPGAHVSALSGSPFSHALDVSVLLQSNPVVLDQLEQCQKSGELAEVTARGKLSVVHFANWQDRLAHLGDAILGRVARREGDRTLAYLSGLAILDLAVAIDLVLQPLADAELMLSNTRRPGSGEERPGEERPGEAPLEEDDPWRPIP